MKPPATALLLVILTLAAGGCKPQPPAQVETIQEYRLETAMQGGKMVFVGAGGEIDGITNPELVVKSGAIVRLTLINGDGMLHDWAIPDLNVSTGMVSSKGQTIQVMFEVKQTGNFDYICTIPGHRQAGMEGKLVVLEP